MSEGGPAAPNGAPDLSTSAPAPQSSHQSSPPATCAAPTPNSSSPSATTTSSASTTQQVQKIILTENELNQSNGHSEWVVRWRQQDNYIATLERRLGLQEGELDDLRQSNEKLKQQLNESQQRERVLMRRLTAKEQETQDYVCQLNELKSAQALAASSIRSSLLDPAVNCILQHLKSELDSVRHKLEDTQNEMTAWKFTPDSNTGKRLMAKCRLLYQENEELGKITSSGRIAKLETDLALQKSFSEEVRQSQNELDSFLADLDEDVEAMQSTILFLQTELRKTKDSVQVLQKENTMLKMGNGTMATTTAAANNVNRSNGDNNSVVVVSEHENERTEEEEDEEMVGIDERTESLMDESNNASARTSNNCNNSSSSNNVKRVRRSSVLSIDYNDDDESLVISTTNGDVAMTSDPE